MPRLKDLRPPVNTLDEAKTLAQQLAHATSRIAVSDARLEKQITDAKARAAERTAEDRAQVVELERSIAEFVTANPHLFKNPRKIKTEFAEFGLRTVTEVTITDLDLMIQALLDCGYDECFKTTRSPIKREIEKRLQDGEAIPGCRLKTGDTVVCKVQSALVKEAVEQALS